MTTELRLPGEAGGAAEPGFSPQGAAQTALIAQLAKELFASAPSGHSHPSATPFVPEKSGAPAPITPAPVERYEPVHPLQDPLTDTPPSDVHPAQPYASVSPHARQADPAAFTAAPGKPHSGPVPGGPGDFYFLSSVPQQAAPAAPRPPGVSSRPPSPGAAPRAAPGAGLSAGLGAGAAGLLDPRAVRRDFPILNQTVNGNRLVWLDNAATTQKPKAVIDALSAFYSRDNSNIHRGAHTLAARATDAFEGARDKLRAFIGAKEPEEIVFVRGTTEGINLVAQSYGRQNVGRGDEILITAIEHHANIVPWQLLAKETGATLRIAPVNDKGELLLDQFASLLSARTKIVAVTHVANALGTVNPVETIVPLAHSYGAVVLIDAAQSSPHLPLNVTALDADFLVLSGHKIYGPTGIGILYGKRALLEDMPPWQGGGHMIKDVTFSRTIFAGIPEKFEAGTPDIGGAVGLGAAVDYLSGIGLPAIAAYEHGLLEYATAGLHTIPGLRILGTAAAKASVLSFVIDGYGVTDVAKHLDHYGIAARSGHHCAQPALRRFGVEESVRASLALYNTREDVDTLIWALHRLPKR